MEDKSSGLNLSPLIPKTGEAEKYHNEIFVPYIYQQLQESIKDLRKESTKRVDLLDYPLYQLFR